MSLKKHPDRTYKNFLLNVRLQSRYTAYLILSSFLIAGVFGFFLYYQSKSYLAIISEMLILDQEQLQELLTSSRRTLIAIIINTIVYFIFLVGVGIIASHRIAGPVFRINQKLEDLIKDDLSELKFREKDLFEGIEATYNRFVRHLADKDQKRKTLTSEIHHKIETILSSSSFNAVKVKREILQDIASDLKKIP